MAAVQRLQQGVRALLAFASPVDADLAAQHLTAAQLALFYRMKRSEQLHSLNVLRDVLAQAVTPNDLAVAALLHDAGKMRYPLAVWQKTFGVLLRAMFPSVYQQWSSGNPRHYLKRAPVVMEQHPAWSAELLNEVGASERAVWLVEHHADSLDQWRDHPYVALLERLRQADDKN